MIKKGTLLVMILVFVIAITGCGTVKTGAKKSWQAVGAVDNWMQKHLW